MGKTIVLLVGLLLLGLDTAPNNGVRFEITPRSAPARNATFTYTFRIPKDEYTSYCHGWVYPVQQWHKEQWPTRSSCRTLNSSSPTLFQEQWGGDHPLPYTGNYQGFLSLYRNASVETRTLTFKLLESVPRGQL